MSVQSTSSGTTGTPALAGKGRLAERFAALRAAKKCGLVTYVTAGDPDASKSADILKALDRGGADVLEIGVPFSEPLADGPVIQRASERALAGGMTLPRTLDLIASVRSSISAPVVLFTYANPVYRFGIDRFVARAVEAGVDGLLVLDLPIEEAGVLHEAAAAAGIDIIWMLSPTTTTERIRKAAESGRGFLYGISRLGVTGVRSEVASGARDLASRIRQETELPIALGFGISRPEHIEQVGEMADAAVVGSALVELIAKNAASPTLAETVETYVRWLKGSGQQPA
jgi:tryptophan synthase alpha chain